MRQCRGQHGPAFIHVFFAEKVDAIVKPRGEQVGLLRDVRHVLGAEEEEGFLQLERNVCCKLVDRPWADQA